MYDLRNATMIWMILSGAVYGIALNYKQAKFWKTFSWIFWWQGAVFFASSACRQYFNSVSSQGWLDYTNRILGPHHSPEFDSGGILYAESHAQYLAGVHEVFWTGLFMSMVYFMIPVVGYFYSHWRNRTIASVNQTVS